MLKLLAVMVIGVVAGWLWQAHPDWQGAVIGYIIVVTSLSGGDWRK